MGRKTLDKKLKHLAKDWRERDDRDKIREVIQGHPGIKLQELVPIMFLSRGLVREQTENHVLEMLDDRLLRGVRYQTANSDRLELVLFSLGCSIKFIWDGGWD